MRTIESATSSPISPWPPRWEWRTSTQPFSAVDDVDQSAFFIVEQVTDKTFSIPESFGFQYNRKDGADPIQVTAKTLPSTDFASIPKYMAWFVSRHGRHTPAALVHDALVVEGMAFDDRVEADRRFLEMMDVLDVPPVQSRVMWSAVTLATRLKCALRPRLGILAWFAAALAGVVLLALGVVATSPWLVVASLALPFLAASLWGRQFWAGVIAGYALPVVVLPAVASFAGYIVYWSIEKTVQLSRRRMRDNRDEPLTNPIGYQGR